jgi:hypothetical protein
MFGTPEVRCHRNEIEFTQWPADIAMRVLASSSLRAGCGANIVNAG